MKVENTNVMDQLKVVAQQLGLQVSQKDIQDYLKVMSKTFNIHEGR
jgi:hypothetical protein